jgi:hypothetical protein
MLRIRKQELMWHAIALEAKNTVSAAKTADGTFKMIPELPISQWK